MNKQPDEAQPSAPEQPGHRYSEEELKRILTDHQEWLETKGEKGTQMQLDQACGDKETILPRGLEIETCPEEQEDSTAPLGRNPPPGLQIQMSLP